MKKKLTFIAVLFAAHNLMAQNSWDGSSPAISTTSTNGNLQLTNGNLGIGGSSAQYKLYSSNTNNAISGGIYSIVNNTSSSMQVGFTNNVISNGNNLKYGLINSISGTSSSGIYGISSSVSTTGNGLRYGVYSYMSGTGTGTKYGLYSRVVNGGSADVRYGIWSEALGSGSQAGHFLGDVETKGLLMLTGNDQGRFLFRTTVASGAVGDQSLQIVPNNTSGLYDWDNDNGLTLYNNGLMEKNTTVASKVFAIKRNDLSHDVFRIYGDGKVYATEINVMLATNFPDYVFKPSYQLMSLAEVKNYIHSNGHLPNIPAAAVIEAEGMNVGEMTRVLVEKVEELTLHLIRQQEEIELLKQQLDNK